MIVAIAGPSRDIARCTRVRDSLRRLGFTIGFDWISQVQRDRDAGRTDADLTIAEREAAGDACLEGIDRAHVILWLADGSEGAAYESGYARAKRKPIVVSGGNPHALYGFRCDARFRDDARAIEFLVGLARGRGERRCA